MKRIIAVLINLFLFLGGVYWQLIGVLWYGKLPKVSIYHFYKKTFETIDKRIYTDEYIQSQIFPSPKIITAEQLIDKIIKDQRLTELDFKMYNSKGKEYGSQSFVSLIREKLDEIKKEKNIL